MTEYADGAGWAAGPDLVYGLFAEAAIGLVQAPLMGVLALDAGAGTGAAARALRARGARVVAVDMSEPMLRAGQRPAIIADIAALPLRTGIVDISVAAFVLAHLPDPLRALRELARVTRPGATVLTTGYPSGVGHPVKDAVEQVLVAYGYVPPMWYVELKQAGEARVGSVEALRQLASQAGLQSPLVEVIDVDIARLGADAAVAWRLGLAHIAPFLAAMDPQRKRELTGQAAAAVRKLGRAAPVKILALRAYT